MLEASDVLLKQERLTIKTPVSRSQTIQMLSLAKIRRQRYGTFGPHNCQYKIIGKKYVSKACLVNIDYI